MQRVACNVSRTQIGIRFYTQWAQVALFVKMLVIRSFFKAIIARRYVRDYSVLPCKTTDIVAIIALICEQIFRLHPSYEGHCQRRIVTLPSGNNKIQRVAVRITNSVDFGRKPATGTA